jgi:AcrR family transcriptional regulator
MSSRRDQILDATRDLLVEEGLQGITMREVAVRVGISPTAIYRHYADKNALLEAAVLEGRRCLVRYFQRALVGKTPRERLHLTGKNYLRFALAHPKEYQVLFMAWDQLPLDLPEAGRHTPTFRFLLDRVEDCVHARLLPAKTDVLDVAMLCWSVCHGLASLYLSGGEKNRMSQSQFQRLADHVMELTLDGLFGKRRHPGAISTKTQRGSSRR